MAKHEYQINCTAEDARVIVDGFEARRDRLTLELVAEQRSARPDESAIAFLEGELELVAGTIKRITPQIIGWVK